MCVMNVYSVWAASGNSVADETILSGNAAPSNHKNVTITENKNESGELESITYTYVIKGKNSDYKGATADTLTGLALSGLAIVSTSDSTFTGKFESDGYIKFTTSGRFDVTVDNAEGSVRLDQLTFAKDTKSTSSTDKFGDSNVGSSTFTYKKSNVEAGTYYFGRSDSNANIEKLIITVYAGEEKIYNWAVDSSDVASLNMEGTFSFVNTTGETNTLKYEGGDYKLSSEYTLWSVDETDTSKNTATVTGETSPYTATVKPQTSWFTAIVPSTVKPTITGYDFSTATDIGNNLTTDNSYGGAYAEYNVSSGDSSKITTSENYVAVGTDSIALYDTSTTYGTYVTLPLKETINSGSVTFSGKVTPSTNSSKWQWLTFGSIAIGAGESNKIALCVIDSSGNKSYTYTSDSKAVTAGNEYEYKLNIDFTNKKASLTITNVGTIEKTDVTLSDISGIVAQTSTSGSRNLTVGNIAITKDITKAASASNPAVFSPATGTSYYAIAVISQNDATINNTVKLGTQSSETVYKNIKIGDSTYSAKDFSSTASENDYVFAVEITGVSDDFSTAVGKIQNLLVSFE